MPIFMCRWPNGDFSVVNAATKNDAIYLLDEVGNGEGCPVKVLKKDFMLHFTLADDGEIELELLGELLDEEIMSLDIHCSAKLCTKAPSSMATTILTKQTKPGKMFGGLSSKSASVSQPENRSSQGL
jgi:hypothetical protein